MGTALKLTQTLVLRDSDNAGHAARVTELASRLAAAMNLSKKRAAAIKPASDPRTREGALAEVERCAGSQFDPQVARVFLTL